jgi:hypothetical protein
MNRRDKEDIEFALNMIEATQEYGDSMGDYDMSIARAVWCLQDVLAGKEWVG